MKIAKSCAVMAVVLVGCQPSVDSARSILERWLGRDLSAQPEELQREAAQALAVLARQDVPGRLWSVHRMRRASVEWLAVEVSDLSWPSLSEITIHMFDRDWKHVRSTTVPTGFRHVVVGVSILPKSPCGSPVVRVSTIAGRAPPYEFRQHFALSQSLDVIFVRLESAKGVALQADYSFHKPMIGPRVRLNRLSQFVSALDDVDPARLLEVLLPLSGRHRQEPVGADSQSMAESPEQAELFLSLQSEPAIRARIAELRKSENDWVRDYAELAASVFGL